MITVEAWTTIRYLRAQGKSIRGIAKELGVTMEDSKDGTTWRWS